MTPEQRYGLYKRQERRNKREKLLTSMSGDSMLHAESSDLGQAFSQAEAYRLLALDSRKPGQPDKRSMCGCVVMAPPKKELTTRDQQEEQKRDEQTAKQEQGCLIF